MPSDRRLLAGLLGLALAAPGPARTMRVPEWARLEVRPVGGVELARAATWEVVLESVVGELAAAAPTVRAVGGAVLSGPTPAAGARVAEGESARWLFRARLDRPEGASHLEVVLPVEVPREALVEAARAAYPDARPGARRELEARILEMPRREPLRGRATPQLTAEEGQHAGEAPRFTYYTEPDALGVRFALWRPAARKGEGAARTALATASPRLRKLLEKAGVSRAPDDGSQAYLALLHQLGREPPQELGPRAEALAARAAPEVAAAAATLAAVAAAQAGRWQDAVQAFERLRDAPSLRHYAHYNLGEALVGGGEPARAAEAYRQALRLRPVFTRARRRLRELEGPEP